MTTDTSDAALAALRIIADPTRWRLLRALRTSDYQVGELVTLLDLPQNLVSYHLGVLRQADFVRLHRSEADARTSYYAADLGALTAAYARIGAELQIVDAPPLAASSLIIFLCTGNSARSQMAEGWLRQLSGGRIPARSAGTHPRRLHPLAVQVMAEVGVDIGYQQAKDIHTLKHQQPDVLVTVCDRAREECLPQISAPVQLHWSIPDPVHAEHAALSAFRTARDDIRQRVIGLLALLPSFMHPSNNPTTMIDKQIDKNQD